MSGARLSWSRLAPTTLITALGLACSGGTRLAGDPSDAVFSDDGFDVPVATDDGGETGGDRGEAGHDTPDGDSDEVSDDGDGGVDEVWPLGCPYPRQEICNGLDDDGDGRMDEGLWCRVSPRPTPFDTYSVWGARADDVWVGGGGGAIHHWDGENWTQLCAGRPANVEAIWGLAGDDLWAVGTVVERYVHLEHAIFHWDGCSWSVVSSGRRPRGLHDVWGSSADDVWAVGDGRWALRLDGAAWSEITVAGHVSYDVDSVWGFARDDVWAGCSLGIRGEVRHWDGTAWSFVAGVDGWSIDKLWGAAPDDVWAVGQASRSFYPDSGPIMHWDGVTWSAVPSATAEDDAVRGVWGSGRDDVYAMAADARLIHWDGTAWTAVPGSGRDVSADRFWGPAADDIWGVGWGLVRFDGREWTDGTTRAGDWFTDIWGAAPDDIWATAHSIASEATLAHWDGEEWTEMTTAIAREFEDLWGFGPDDVWAVGSPGVIARWDGTAWTEVARTTWGGAYVNGIWGSSPSDVWVVGDSSVHHWDGGELTWTSLPSTGRLLRVDGSGPDDVWAAGETDYRRVTTLFHWDGRIWSAATLADRTCSVRAIRVFAPDDAWAACDEELLRWDGSDWRLDHAEPVALNVIWAAARDDIWFAGEDGHLVHWNGSDWSHPTCMPAGSWPVNALWGFPGGDVWAAGALGTILRFRP